MTDDMPPPDSAFSDEDIASNEDIASIISEEDLRQRSQKLDEAQERWENLAYLATEKIPCPECGGNGNVGGYLCPSCMGQRVLESPDSDGPGFEMPKFAELRAAITAYGNALADRALPDGHLAKRQLALPAASTVPTLAALTKLDADGKAKGRELKQLGAAGRGTDPRSLPAPKPERGISDETDLGDIDDAELAEMEDAANKSRGRK